MALLQHTFLHKNSLLITFKAMNEIKLKFVFKSAFIPKEKIMLSCDIKRMLMLISCA